jgi:undecaprenyl-diphosphatase
MTLMIVLLPVVVVAVAGAAAVLAVMARWPHADPGAPRLTPPAGAGAATRKGVLARRLDPEAATGLTLTAAAVALVVFGAVAGMVQTRTGVAGLDLGAAQWAAGHATPAATGVLRVLTGLGATVTAVVAAVLVVLVSRRRVPPGRAALLAALVIGGQWLLVNLVKAAIDRARPDIDRLVDPFGSSFPSSHAATAAAAFATFALLLGRGRSRPWRAGLAATAAGLAGAVATSRVLLGVHWLTDVMAGLALGWAWFALCSMAVGGRRLDLGDPLEADADAADADAAAS